MSLKEPQLPARFTRGSYEAYLRDLEKWYSCPLVLVKPHGHGDGAAFSFSSPETLRELERRHAAMDQARRVGPVTVTECGAVRVPRDNYIRTYLCNAFRALGDEADPRRVALRNALDTLLESKRVTGEKRDVLAAVLDDNKSTIHAVVELVSGDALTAGWYAVLQEVLQHYLAHYVFIMKSMPWK